MSRYLTVKYFLQSYCTLTLDYRMKLIWVAFLFNMTSFRSLRNGQPHCFRQFEFFAKLFHLFFNVIIINGAKHHNIWSLFLIVHKSNSYCGSKISISVILLFSIIINYILFWVQFPFQFPSNYYLDIFTCYWLHYFFGTMLLFL